MVRSLPRTPRLHGGRLSSDSRKRPLVTFNPSFRINSRGDIDVRISDSPRWIDRMINWLVGHLYFPLGVHGFSQIHKRLLEYADSAEQFFCNACKAMNVGVSFDRARLGIIPKTGAVIVVAPHPHSGVEALAIAEIISHVRTDIRIMSNNVIEALPAFKPYLITANIYGQGEDVRQKNSAAAVNAADWLKQGGVLIIFPAGSVSSQRIRQNGKTYYVDRPWNAGVGIMARKGKAAILPIFVDGKPSLLFRSVRRMNRLLGTFLLLREIVGLRNSTLKLSIGDLMSHEGIIEEIRADRDAFVARLQRLTYQLGGIRV